MISKVKFTIGDHTVVVDKDDLVSVTVIDEDGKAEPLFTEVDISANDLVAVLRQCEAYAQQEHTGVLRLAAMLMGSKARVLKAIKRVTHEDRR